MNEEYGNYQVCKKHHITVKVVWLDIWPQNLLKLTELPITNTS